MRRALLSGSLARRRDYMTECLRQSFLSLRASFGVGNRRKLGTHVRLHDSKSGLC